MVVWSSWGLCIRWLPVPPWAVTFYVGVVGAALSAGLWLARGGSPRELWPRRHRGLVAALGVLFAANSVTFFLAYERTTVANAILTHYTAPIFVAALAPLALGERLSPRTPAAIALAAAGMVLLLPGGELAFEGRNAQGLLLGTASGAAYALLILLARHLGPRVPPLLLIFYQNAAVVALLLPWAVSLGPPADLSILGWLALVGTVHGTGAGLLYLSGIRSVTAQTAAVLGYLEPLGAVLLAAAFLGERPAPWGLAAGCLILAGGALVALGPQAEPA